jgi:ubiquinone/menaquinone biosynthesis C-methylase UbiE
MRCAEEFWNNKENIDWFTNQPTSSYWLDFFNGVADKQSSKVLDLGCGGGRNTEMLAKMGFDVYACDRYEGMANQTKKRLIKFGWLQNQAETKIKEQDMTKTGYRNNFFDCILAHGIYHNAFTESDYEKAIGESARILKPGGILCFNIFTSNTIGKGVKKIKDNLYETKEKLPMVLYSKSQFLSLAMKKGLSVESEIFEYNSKVTTGERSVMRGFLTKV